MTEDLDSKDVVEEPEDMELGLNLIRQVPLGIVFLRIVIVTSMSFSAAAGIFLLVAGAWPLTLACLALTVVFMFLMFFVESLAAPDEDT
ncbi:MAG: hypothetical protein ABIP58_03550 [Dehalococcoidia bacterium]